jgi:hypothetical protein
MRHAAIAVLTAAAALAATPRPASAQQADTAAAAISVAPSADASVSPEHRSVSYGGRGWLRVGGLGQWRSYLRFDAPSDALVKRAVLRLRVSRPAADAIDVRVGLGGSWSGGSPVLNGAPRVGARVKRFKPVGCRPGTRTPRRATCGNVVIDVTAALRPGRPLVVVLTSTSPRLAQIASNEALRGRPRLVVTAASRPAAPPAPSPAVQAPSGTGPVAGVWTSAAELASRPMSGPAWQAMKAAADSSGSAKISDQNSFHDVNTLAAALVYARTGNAAYRQKAAAAISSAIGTERGGRTLALGRNLVGYVAAADLIGLGSLDPGLDGRFRSWLTGVRSASLSGDTLISTHEQRPNNWGTMAGASRMAADVYLGDKADLDRAANVFRGWLGERAAYSGFNFGDLSWQADAGQPVAVEPQGATKDGLDVDGALADDMRRGCGPKAPPCQTDYAWEAMQGVVVQAQILARRGYDSWGWGNRAMLRAANFLERLDRQFGGWWASADDEWQPWVINRAYGTNFRKTTPAQPGKIMGWTDWVFG